MELSVIIPVYYGENLVTELIERLDNTLPKLCKDHEIILVEDGSPDNSWGAIIKNCQKKKHIKGIKLSRNFGQHSAITAGLYNATGNWVVVMDCDLQDQPEEIASLYAKAKQGYDIVLARRFERQDRFLKKLSSSLFYKVFSYLTDTKQDSSIANFGIYNKKVITAVLNMNDKIRYFPAMVQWVGFKSTKINVKHSSRPKGKSTYTLFSLFKLASSNIIGFSDKPLKITAKFGFGLSLLSILMGLIYLYKYVSGTISVLGFTSIIISISFFSGVIIFTLGIIGIYLGKTFEQTKDRPTFIIKEVINE